MIGSQRGRDRLDHGLVAQAPRQGVARLSRRQGLGSSAAHGIESARRGSSRPLTTRSRPVRPVRGEHGVALVILTRHPPSRKRTPRKDKVSRPGLAGTSNSTSRWPARRHAPILIPAGTSVKT